MKNCLRCNQEFDCEANSNQACWCNELPSLLHPVKQSDCLCPSCYHQELRSQIDVFVAKMTPEKATAKHSARGLALKPFIEDIDYYVENGLYVFTAWHHLKRGDCCGNGCRHCPYGNSKS